MQNDIAYAAVSTVAFFINNSLAHNGDGKLSDEQLTVVVEEVINNVKGETFSASPTKNFEKIYMPVLRRIWKFHTEGE